MALTSAAQEYLNISLFLLIFAGTIIITRFAKKVLGAIFHKNTKHHAAAQFHFTEHFAIAVIYIVGAGIAVYLIPPLRSISVSIFASAGVLAIIIGFAAQQAFANIISGIFLAIFKPFKVGDRVQFSNSEVSGIIEDLTLRHTVIRTFENKRIIVPNSTMNNETISNDNYVDDNICRYVDFGISYDSDIDKAMRIMQEESEKHPFIYDNRTDEEKASKKPVVSVRLMGFSDSSVNLRAWVWARSPRDAFLMGCDLNKSIKERFDKEGVEIPYPYRTIVYKNNKKR